MFDVIARPRFNDVEFQIRLHPRVRNQLIGWGLSEFLLVEVYLQLREKLGQNPIDHLHRDTEGDGNFFVFETRDPGDPHFQQIFMFRVHFDEDEKTLNIVNGSYWRNFQP